MPTTDVSVFAKESVESILNGNTGDVIGQIDKLPKKQAIAAVAYIIHYLSGDDYQTGTFLRRLSNRL